MEAKLLAVDGQAQVRYVQVASAAQGTNDGDRGTCLVACYGGVLVGATWRWGYFGRSWPFGWPGMPLLVIPLCRGGGRRGGGSVSILVGSMDHRGGFCRPHSARVGIAFRFWRQMMGLRSRRGAASLRLQLLVRQAGAQFLAGNFPQVLAMKMEGILAGNIPDDSSVGDLTQPLLQLHCIAATVPGILLQL